MFFGRPLKYVLGKIVPFGKKETIHPENLGHGVADDTTFLRGDGIWTDLSSPNNGDILFGGSGPDEDVYKMKGGIGVSINSKVLRG